MQKTTYIQWKPGSHHKVSAEVAYKEVERLRKLNGGVVTPEILVQEAASKKNPLHPEIYDKSGDEAAQEYYRSRASMVLRSIEVEVEGSQTGPVREYTPVILPSPKKEDPEEGGDEDEGPSSKLMWMPLEDALKDPEKRKQVLARAVAELKAFRKKYNQLKELAAVWEAVDKV